VSAEDLVGASTFPREARLRKPQQFQATFSQGQRINAPLFRLHVRLTEPGALAAIASSSADMMVTLSRTNKLARSFNMRVDTASIARLGISVSKKVSASAVERNRIRRAVRESFRRVRAQLPPGDYALLAQRNAAGVSISALQESLSSLWRRSAALKPLSPALTMPMSASKPAVLDASHPPTHHR
jgi:ribonuclease P protein component